MIGSFTSRILPVVVVLCVTLSGCTLAEVLGKLETDRESRPQKAPAEPAGNESIAIIDGAAPRLNREAAPRPKPKPVGFDVDPQALVNLEETKVREVMGSPAMVREEPPAIIWSYLAGECRLDVYLYESLSTKALRSLTYVVETSRRGVNPEKYCLRRLN